MSLIILSNRLPITVRKHKDQLVYHHSIGGLATGVEAFLQQGYDGQTPDYQWLGWAGGTVAIEDEGEVSDYLAKHRCYPVFLSHQMMNKYYEGFCNSTLWPLFHYMLSFTSYDDKQWLIYKRVNELYCDAITKYYKPGDTIWIHDYHLLLLPLLLREKFPAMTIGFFLHIPFPALEILEFLPARCREALLSGLLGADLIGFHLHDYALNFIKCVQRMLGYPHEMGIIHANNRRVKVDYFPMGIDYDYFHQYASQKDAQLEKKKLLKDLDQAKVLLSIDRLDYTKGIIHRLKNFELFLIQNPEWHRHIVFILLIAPSRTNIKYYKQTIKRINELVGEINGEFADTGWQPILYQYHNFSVDELITFYTISDVAIVTPLRDGMNLIAKEYIACKVDQKGSLILSETAGAAKDLVDAIIVNPNCELEIAEAIKKSIEMPGEEQRRRMAAMQKLIKEQNVIEWGHAFMTALYDTKAQCSENQVSIMHDHLPALVNHYKSAKKRLILLDYDGTLMPFAAMPDQVSPSEKLLALLKALAADEHNHVVIISGRNKDSLQRWFGHLNIGLAAEHGAWVKVDQAWQAALVLDMSWKKNLITMMEAYTKKLAGTFIEVKDYSLVWHYRNSEAEIAHKFAGELYDCLLNYSGNAPIKVMLGRKIIEVRSSMVGKDYAVRHFNRREQYEFILAMGDDVTDEDMFKALPDFAYSVKIGSTITAAKFMLPEQTDVHPFLTALLDK